MNHKLWLLGRSAAIGGHVLREKITRPTADAYRQQSMFAYAAWALTIGGGAAYQPKMQSVETCLTLLRRITTAVDAPDSLGALGV
ncbi:hypothetical protein [Nocardia sp. R6R-6]|uniref:hypothetical protein n=1 Tax=Nocardia sp. R6R-6 TaxID=3459303 RepID=UPI00403D9FBF